MTHAYKESCIKNQDKKEDKINLVNQENSDYNVFLRFPYYDSKYLSEFKWLKNISYLCRNVVFRPQNQNKLKPKTKNQNKGLYVRLLTSGMRLWLWHMIQTRVWMCDVCSATSGRDLSTSNLGCLYLTRLVLLGFLSQSSPLVSLSPLKAAGAWPLQHWPSKLSSFQLRRMGNLPVPSHQQHPIQLQR